MIKDEIMDRLDNLNTTELQQESILKLRLFKKGDIKLEEIEPYVIQLFTRVKRTRKLMDTLKVRLEGTPEWPVMIKSLQQAFNGAHDFAIDVNSPYADIIGQYIVDMSDGEKHIVKKAF